MSNYENNSSEAFPNPRAYVVPSHEFLNRFIVYRTRYKFSSVALNLFRALPFTHHSNHATILPGIAFCLAGWYDGLKDSHLCRAVCHFSPLASYIVPPRRQSTERGLPVPFQLYFSPSCYQGVITALARQAGQQAPGFNPPVLELEVPTHSSLHGAGALDSCTADTLLTGASLLFRGENTSPRLPLVIVKARAPLQQLIVGNDKFDGHDEHESRKLEERGQSHTMCQDLNLSGTNLCLVPHRGAVLLTREDPPPAPHLLTMAFLFVT